MATLIDLDRRLFLALNELHSSWLDPVMVWVSGNIIWIPLYVILLYHLFKLPRVHAVVAVLSIALGIALSDQLTSSLMKPMFERARPTWDTELGPLVHTVNNYRGGHFGFPSSHAANTFCAAMLLNLILQRRWLPVLFFWAALVSYSRIYLGVHFPGDVTVGAILGMACGWIAYQVYLFGCRAGDKLANRTV